MRKDLIYIKHIHLKELVSSSINVLISAGKTENIEILYLKNINTLKSCLNIKKKKNVKIVLYYNIYNFYIVNIMHIEFFS